MQLRTIRPRSILTVGFALAAFAASTPVHATQADAALANLAGKWTLSYNSPDGRHIEPTLKLSVEGEEAEGTLTTDQYGKFDLEDITLKDGVLRFEIDGEIDGQDIHVTYEAKVDGDTLDGSFDYEYAENTGTVDFEGKRAMLSADDVVGTWQLTIEAPDGQVFEPVLTVETQGDGLKGTYDSQMGGELPVEEIAIEGQTLTFRIAGDANGQRFRIEYKAEVDGDSMSGEVMYDLAGTTGTLDFEGERTDS